MTKIGISVFVWRLQILYQDLKAEACTIDKCRGVDDVVAVSCNDTKKKKILTFLLFIILYLLLSPLLCSAQLMLYLQHCIAALTKLVLPHGQGGGRRGKEDWPNFQMCVF